jgi:SAM-dependent methyltransferase
MEERHHDLFQELWVNFDEADYEDRIDRYRHRLRVNDLATGFLDGKACIDFGCGHGNFAHALLRDGAGSVTGIDYGEESIRFAIAARDRLGVPAATLDFRVESVYGTSAADASFDFAIQNGVFHHLDDEDAAYREVHRVLKPGGWFWIYTDGAGGLTHDLWDVSVRILRDVPAPLVIEVLDFLEVETNKRYHLGDGLNAVYRHSTYEDLIARLQGYGFGNPRRLVGGFPTDLDHDVVEADPYGVEKFGSGDIRVLVQKV